MSENLVEELRLRGIEQLRANEPEAAISLFDQALAHCASDDSRELLRINKAFPLIALGRFEEPEVRELPRIVFRRRNPRHVYLAAYRLSYKFRLEGANDRAAQYAKIAVEIAEEAGELDWLQDALTELGSAYLLDSQFDEATACYERVLRLLDGSPSPLKRAMVTQNLGYAAILRDDPASGVGLIESALELMQIHGFEGFVAESHLDLALGYLELGQYELAQHHGRLGLETAREDRQVRNGHYLLGEIAHYRGDSATAEFHFEHLCRFYPDFPQLKNLLYAIDLRGVINWKL